MVVVLLICLLFGFKLALCYCCFIGWLTAKEFWFFSPGVGASCGVIVVLFSLVRLGCFMLSSSCFFSFHHTLIKLFFDPTPIR